MSETWHTVCRVLFILFASFPLCYVCLCRCNGIVAGKHRRHQEAQCALRFVNQTNVDGDAMLSTRLADYQEDQRFASPLEALFWIWMFLLIILKFWNCICGGAITMCKAGLRCANLMLEEDDPAPPRLTWEGALRAMRDLLMCMMDVSCPKCPPEAQFNIRINVHSKGTYADQAVVWCSRTQIDKQYAPPRSAYFKSKVFNHFHPIPVGNLLALINAPRLVTYSDLLSQTLLERMGIDTIFPPSAFVHALPGASESSASSSSSASLSATSIQPGSTDRRKIAKQTTKDVEGTDLNKKEKETPADSPLFVETEAKEVTEAETIEEEKIARDQESVELMLMSEVDVTDKGETEAEQEDHAMEASAEEGNDDDWVLGAE
uniref:Uncharacterized protein n=1 Tax=Chromera velia CCMP2878 TaxID=1169474 RepID=A0A0G4HSP3_9ALVE|eukprot:Cvel_8305.t1-p1 / transcript=Cvel_8305.t1 / gene=Cvel_8305 / organism=Chromera_velia_CCMP2878 / gene_product=hypothetical protein / transcript_product=hypothetical protein / location=Cvel_scaffold456:31265-34198(+) / protein_length=375 / sequence_SO=supercontig / SO=protein_coding / is_pseudo=false